MIHRPTTPFRIDPALQAFRGEARAAPVLHPLEKALLVIVGIHLCFTPWALGTMYNSTQFISLGFAVAALAVALVNREYSPDITQERGFKLIMWPKLVRFPLFWIGLILFGYITVQALNPSWIYAANGRSTWVVPIDYITWLPTSVEAPFSKMNAWHALMLYATPWLVLCAIWVGFTRRVAVQHLLTIVVANGALLALVGILQRATGTNKMLWLITPPLQAGQCFATIIYKNHAGAYFNLVFMLCVVLFYRHFARSERRLERANPAPVFAFLAVLIGMGVLLTSSRAASLLMIGFSTIAFIAFIMRCIATRGEGRSPLTIGLLGAGFVLFIGLGAYFVNFNNSFSRLGHLITSGTNDTSVSSRIMARDAAWDMAQDRLMTGWGAGSFRHIFPDYQKNYPDIVHPPDRADRANVYMRWTHPHNDYVELMDEFGLVGAVLFVSALFCGVRHLWRQHIFRRPHLMFAVLALAATMAHAFVDFPTHNPAILLLWCSAAALTARWAEFEGQRG